MEPTVKSTEKIAIEKILQASDSVFDKFVSEYDKFVSEYPVSRRILESDMHASWRACAKWLSSALVSLGGESLAKKISSAPIDKLDRLP